MSHYALQQTSEPMLMASTAPHLLIRQSLDYLHAKLNKAGVDAVRRQTWLLCHPQWYQAYLDAGGKRLGSIHAWLHELADVTHVSSWRVSEEVYGFVILMTGHKEGEETTVEEKIQEHVEVDCPGVLRKEHSISDTPARDDIVVRIPDMLAREDGFSLAGWLELHGIDTRLAFECTYDFVQGAMVYRQKGGEQRARVGPLRGGDDVSEMPYVTHIAEESQPS